MIRNHKTQIKGDWTVDNKLNLGGTSEVKNGPLTKPTQLKLQWVSSWRDENDMLQGSYVNSLITLNWKDKSSGTFTDVES